MPLRRSLSPLVLALALAAPGPALRADLVFVAAGFTFQGASGPVHWINTLHHTAEELAALTAQLKAAGDASLLGYVQALDRAAAAGATRKAPLRPSSADEKAATEANPLVGLRLDGRGFFLQDLVKDQDFAQALFFPGQTLAGRDLSGCTFANADLAGVDLSACTLTGCCFDGAHLVGTQLPPGALEDPANLFQGAVHSGGKLDLRLRPDKPTKTPPGRTLVLAGPLELGLEVGREGWYAQLPKGTVPVPVTEVPLDGLDRGRPLGIVPGASLLSLLMEDRKTLVKMAPESYWIFTFPEPVGALGPHDDGLWCTLPASGRILFSCGRDALANRAANPVATLKGGVAGPGLPASRLETLTVGEGGGGIDLTLPRENGTFATARIFAAQDGERVLALGPVAPGSSRFGLAATTRGLVVLGTEGPRRLPLEACPFKAEGPVPALAQDKGGRLVVLQGGVLHHLHPGRPHGKRKRGGELVPLPARALADKVVSGLACCQDGTLAFCTSRPSGLGRLDGNDAQWWALDEGSQPVEIVEAGPDVFVLRLAGRNSLLSVHLRLLAEEAAARKAEKPARAQATPAINPPKPPPTPAQPAAEEKTSRPAPYGTIGLDHILQGHAHGADPTRGWFPKGATRAWIAERAAEAMTQASHVLDSFQGRKLFGRTFDAPIGHVVDACTGQRVETRSALCVYDPADRHVVTFYPVWSLPRYPAAPTEAKDR
ncbi:pentapeptide repeat-containing protein [Mesoterricola sediminis]|uniref:Pentapeptide repeat-containing protein n=1 Tax=Mesoterricola sediminis TaxID=2927980 RepID=A0AA48KB56_9BACT|nr:pentapeptide repeat-containing protein [Mesoterricola sediminis]BDU75769.1 hypothetical protein METESE_07270 [Mesoterricola sediminis]